MDVNVIFYNPPACIDELNTAAYEGGMPVDVALLAAARVGEAHGLRQLADAAEAEGSFAVALGKLRERADYLDPEGGAR